MDRVYQALQSMTAALKGQLQTSMISHLANVFFGYTQLQGQRRAANGPRLDGGQGLTNSGQMFICMRENEKFLIVFIVFPFLTSNV